MEDKQSIITKSHDDKKSVGVGESMICTDEFFDKQPEKQFIEKLRQPVHRKKPVYFKRSSKESGEVCVSGMYINNSFPDEKGVLETAFEDFKVFLQVFELEGGTYPICIISGETACFESYSICVAQTGCTITASDTEGIRRALVYLEDELQRREGPFLPIGEISRKPVIRTRITRGFFSPTNRPPMCIDELMDDVDYYPDEYLNRLAHDGTNGIWIYTRFQDLVRSKIFSEYGVNCDQRIAKLKKVIHKCARYGIKVYAFVIEPLGLTPDMAEKYRDVTGIEAVGLFGWDGNKTLCTCSELGEKYCIEATERLFTIIPELAGIIDLTAGELPTSCSNFENMHMCPRCGKYSRGEVLGHTVDLLQEGIRRAEEKTGISHELISWTYAHREWPMDEICNYVSKGPADSIYMQNFEDAGYQEQLGKTRQAIDYWLSYVGPSGMFERTAREAAKYGKRMYAKMQVCCSHELATVPYIPVPGILFDKYKAACALAVEGVMQCWYFGNWPSLMSKAAGELSFEEDFSDKQAFLKKLAGIYVGNHQAEDMLKVWTCFEEGYKQYPTNIMFSYYGPMHDGVVWELALIPKNNALPRSWLLLDKTNGDRIGECLQSGHTLEEAIFLCENMRDCWKEGLKRIPENCPEEQVLIAKALEVLFTSGCNILNFYRLRHLLGKGAPEGGEILEGMRKIVEDEISNSKSMAELCKLDGRLGYHSEAEGYKFFPEKLEWRIQSLERLLATEFSEVQRNIVLGNAPLPYYLGETKDAYYMADSLENAEKRILSDGSSSFRAAYDADKLYIELQGKKGTAFTIGFEYELMWASPAIILCNGQKKLAPCVITHQSVWGQRIDEELNKYDVTIVSDRIYRVTILREKVGWNTDRPIKFRLKADNCSWIQEEQPVVSLGKDEMSPGEYGWLLCRGKNNVK